MTEDIPGYNWENALSDADYAVFKMGLDGYGGGALFTTDRHGVREAEHLNELMPLFIDDEIFVRARGTQGTDLPKTSIAPVLFDVATRTATRALEANKELSHGVTQILTSMKNDHVLVERILEANRQLIACNQSQRQLNAAMAKMKAAAKIHAYGLPEQGTVSVSELADASDEVFIRLVSAASVLHPNAYGTRASLFRYLGKSEGFDAAYEQFWTHSNLNRELFDQRRHLCGIGLDADVSVRFYADPFNAAREFDDLSVDYALDTWEILRDGLLALDVPDGWATSADAHVLAAGALRAVLEGDADTAGAALISLSRFWRITILMTVKDGRAMVTLDKALKQVTAAGA